MIGNEKPKAKWLAVAPVLAGAIRQTAAHMAGRRWLPYLARFLSPAAFPLFPVVFLTLAFLTCVAAPVGADGGESQIWLISTRGASHACGPEASLESLCYSRLEEGGCWTPADAEAFAATDDVARPTVVFLHGNRTDVGWAVRKGIFTYDVIRSASGCRPMRYVIWSWPAERMCRGFKKDAQLKTDFGDVECHYLARWLDSLRPEVKVSLVGHSLGPRIITGALHLLAGGEVGGQGLPPETVAAWSGGKRKPVRAVLLASAIDADGLAPGGCNDRALSLVDRMLITRDGCDRVLRWYPHMNDGCGPQAMGLVGPCGIGDAKNVEVVDVTCQVGKIHDWRPYCVAPSVCCRWAQYVFLED